MGTNTELDLQVGDKFDVCYKKGRGHAKCVGRYRKWVFFIHPCSGKEPQVIHIDDCDPLGIETARFIGTKRPERKKEAENVNDI